jgi:hypothetical protein
MWLLKVVHMEDQYYCCYYFAIYTSYSVTVALKA